MLGCCQQPTKSSGAASFRCFGGHFSPKSLWRAARPGSRCRRGSDTARYLGSEVGKKVAQPTPATRIVDRGRCTLLKQCTYIVRDLGQQPTTWMGTGCCSTGGKQQRSQPSAEQGLQLGKELARSAFRANFFSFPQKTNLAFWYEGRHPHPPHPRARRSGSGSPSLLAFLSGQGTSGTSLAAQARIGC